MVAFFRMKLHAINIFMIDGTTVWPAIVSFCNIILGLVTGKIIGMKKIKPCIFFQSVKKVVNWF